MRLGDAKPQEGSKRRRRRVGRGIYLSIYRYRDAITLPRINGSLEGVLGGEIQQMTGS